MSAAPLHETAPPAWRALLAELAGIPVFGAAGVRDPESPCDVFDPVGVEWWRRKHANGTCDTDGHYMCAECSQISEAALRMRRDECPACGTKLQALACPKCDVEPAAVPAFSVQS